MENINKQFETINEILDRIDVKQKEINEKLDELIKALHNYDEGLEMFEDEPKQGACVKHDEASWEQEDELNKRMDIIGQNGNTGEHYEYDDYGKRVENKDKSNNSAKHVGKNKKRNTGKKSAVVEHQKYPPHKH